MLSILLYDGIQSAIIHTQSSIFLRHQNNWAPPWASGRSDHTLLIHGLHHGSDGTMVVPSECFPSVWYKPHGSRQDDNCCCKCPVHDVIHCCMSVVTAAFTLTTAKAIRFKTVFLLSVVVACVGPAKGSTQIKACCYSDSVIIHTQTEWRDGQCMYTTSLQITW